MLSARPSRFVAALVLGGALVATACADDDTDSLFEGSDSSTATSSSTGSESTLDWGDCPEDDQPLMGTIECTTLTVPLDYDDPDGETIDLSLVRVPAASDRDGAVLTNPGGPGGSGVDLVVNAGSTIQQQMGLNEFDIVGFDPRGVDRSGGIDCVSDEVLDEHLYVDPTPDDADERRLLDESKNADVEECQQKYGDDLIHYSTENTARDMDEIRAALGDNEISYIGISYGTYLGAVYATMFPDHVRAMVLDSAYEPTGDTIEQQYLTQLEGFEGAFDDWASWCAGDRSCAFSADDAATIGKRWDQLYDGLDAKSLVVDGRTVNQVTLETATVGSMYSRASWPDLAGALAQAAEGDGSGILRIADTYEQRRPDGTFASIGQSGPVIRCASGLDPVEPDDPRALLDELREVAPRFSRDYTLDDLKNRCSELVGEVVEPTELRYEGDAPILVVGGTNDPATPFRWAEELTAAMGDSAALVTYTGEGHGQILTSSCVTDLEAEVIDDLELPDDDDTTCEPDPPVERPEWWDEIPTPNGVSPQEELPAVAAALGLTPSQAYASIHLTELPGDDLFAAYRQPLEDAGFSHLTDQELIPGLESQIYTPPDALDAALMVLAIPPAALEEDDLAPLAEVVPEGQTVVVVAAIPF